MSYEAEIQKVNVATTELLALRATNSELSRQVNDQRNELIELRKLVERQNVIIDALAFALKKS